MRGFSHPSSKDHSTVSIWSVKTVPKTRVLGSGFSFKTVARVIIRSSAWGKKSASLKKSNWTRTELNWIRKRKQRVKRQKLSHWPLKSEIIWRLNVGNKLRNLTTLVSQAKPCLHSESVVSNLCKVGNSLAAQRLVWELRSQKLQGATEKKDNSLQCILPNKYQN